MPLKSCKNVRDKFMKISLEWLKEFISLQESAETLDHLLTMSGLEVEGIDTYETIKGGLQGLVVGEVLQCERHPNADKLSVTVVDLGAEQVQIVCGAPNVAKGQKVVVATVGTTLYPSEGEPFKIKKGKIRGEESLGMICAEDEIGLGASHAGIMVLDTDLPNGTPAAEYFQVQPDTVIEIGLTPNRVDAASHYGVARDLKVLLGRELCFPDLSSFAVAANTLSIPVRVEDEKACPRYAGITLTGVQVAPSPEWLQRRLQAIGLTPINNVVDITNYVLHGLGQPMHAFDADRIAGGQVVVRSGLQGQKFTTLDGTERTLHPDDLMICDAEKPMCIAGVFGGAHSGVSEQTTSVFLESAYFHPDSVRATAQRHGLKTDASFRFERGTDPNMVIPALQLAAILVRDIAGGTIASDIQDIYPAPVAPFRVKARYAFIDRLIGKHIAPERIKEILLGLDMQIVEETAEDLLLDVPPYRVDVRREADIVEEILRIYGLNNVELSEHLSSSYMAPFPEKDKDRIQSKVTEMLAGAGCSEIMTNSLTTSAYADLVETLDSAQNVKILNVLSAELDVMRQSLLFTGLESVLHNINRQQRNLRLFEFGKVYRHVEGAYQEEERLSIFVTGAQQEESWRAKTTKTAYHDLASLAERVLQRLGLSAYEQQQTASDLFAYGMDYMYKGKLLVSLGMVHPKVTKALGIKQEVFFAECSWANILEAYSAKYQFREIPKFPEVRRDLSLVMDKAVTFEQVKQVAMKAERKLLKRVNVFDVYEGEHLEAGKKSYSVSVMLQDEEKTLTDKVIDGSMQRLMSAFEKELGILIRK